MSNIVKEFNDYRGESLGIVTLLSDTIVISNL
jgi:hypothetical protein